MDWNQEKFIAFPNWPMAIFSERKATVGCPIMVGFIETARFEKANMKNRIEEVGKGAFLLVSVPGRFEEDLLMVVSGWVSLGFHHQVF